MRGSVHCRAGHFPEGSDQISTLEIDNGHFVSQFESFERIVVTSIGATEAATIHVPMVTFFIMLFCALVEF